VSSTDAAWELPGYELLERIALGGRGEIYLARRGGRSGELVVIKLLRAEDAGRPDRITAFIDEARISTVLVHPNIVRVYHGDVHRGLPYLVMEHVDGITLWDLVERSRMLNAHIPHGEAAYIASQVAEALAYAHELTDPRGKPLHLIHRDVSAVNVMITFDGVVKLLDFGIARSTLRSLSTAPGVIKGKLDYLSPEQCTGGEIDALTDLYSLGVLLFEMITGVRPFPEKQVEKLFVKVARGDRPRVRAIRPDVPPALERIVDRAMAVKRKSRYPSAHAVLEDLRSFMSGLPVVPNSSTLAALVSDLAYDRVDRVAGTYGPAHTTAVERIDLAPETELAEPGSDLLDGPTIADSRLMSALVALQSEAAPAEVPAAEPETAGYRTTVEERNVHTAPDRSEPLDDVAPLGPTSLFRRPLLLLLTIVALFCLATLLGIVVTLALRGRHPDPAGHSTSTPAKVVPAPVAPVAADRGPPPLPAELQAPAPEPRPAPAPAPPALGAIALSVIPPGSRALVAGQSRVVPDEGLVVEVPPGTHEVLVSAPGHRDAQQDVEVRAGITSRVEIRLEPAGGTLSVYTHRRAMLHVGGEKIGLTPVVGLDLSPGEYEIRLTNRYGTRRRNVRIIAGEETKVSVRN
jgi:serine/threonine protein kinase